WRDLDFGIICLRRFQPMWVNVQSIAGGDDHRPFDEILQLADVAGPVILQKQPQGRWIDALDELVQMPAEMMQEVMHQVWNVFTTLPQRRDMNGKHVQTKVEI